ncbi:caspase-3-like [Diadema setosum]|uniref:caspase-3-like n=1 Tax=Diadema setosum TaxID=31175 RepID=UPI003B3A908A
MNLRDKGMAFILNNNNFVDRRKRKGSEVDVLNVTHVFQEIGYKIVVVQDLAIDEIREALASLKTKIRPSHTSVVLVFMSHGDREGICGKDGKVITVEEIKETLSGRNCPELRGKPKIFFFQACRGEGTAQMQQSHPNVPNYHYKMTTSATDKTVQPVSRPDRSTGGAGSFNPVDIGDESGKGSGLNQAKISQPIELDSIPDNAHMLIAHATCEGYVALRDNVNGSWFIQALCEELIAGAHLYDLSTIMTKVSGRVQRQRGCVRQEMGTVITYQTTQTISQGIVKKIYFLPKYPPYTLAAVSRSMKAATRNHVV